ncbi:MAG: hypothetical protein Q8K92_08240 [Leadbetterella sp.]|nr:hypothetical protein [Leadbetterella sp.]
MQLKYEKAQRLWEKGKISKAELEALKPEAALRLCSVTDAEAVAVEAAVMKVLTKGSVAETLGRSPRVLGSARTDTGNMVAIQLNADALEAVSLLKAEMHEIDKKKGALSNSLGSYPKNVPVPQITEQILSLRDEWANRSKMVKLIDMNGLSTPLEVTGKAEPLSNEAMQQAIIDSLPTDKYELKSKERNLVSVLSKDRGKLRAAKDPGKKQELTVKIQQNEILLEAMRERLKR